MNVSNQTVITLCRCHQNVNSWKIDLSFVSDEAHLLITVVVSVHPIPAGLVELSGADSLSPSVIFLFFCPSVA